MQAGWWSAVEMEPSTSSQRETTLGWVAQPHEDQPVDEPTSVAASDAIRHFL